MSERLNSIMQVLLLSLLGFVFPMIGTAQDTLAPKKLSLFLEGAVLGGVFQQQLSDPDFRSGYIGPLNTAYGTVKFTKAISKGFMFQGGCFFGPSRRWGLGTGFMMHRETFRASLDKIHLEYQAYDANGNVFRKIIRNSDPISESHKITHYSIPFMLKFKQAMGDKWSLFLDAGLRYTFTTRSDFTMDAKFDHEAIYKFDQSGGFVYDDSPDPGNSSWLITKAEFLEQNPDGSVEAYFKKLEGDFDVGLERKPSETRKLQYVEGSIGVLFHPLIAYAWNENLSLCFGGYFAWQKYKLKNDDYRLLDDEGTYASVLASSKTRSEISFGLQAGLRFFIPKPKDQDKDGIVDKKDDCPDLFGLAQYRGCPDLDGDFIVDHLDSCPTIPGLVVFNGCPDSDRDSIIDKFDECPDLPGTIALHGCPDTDGDGIVDPSDACPTLHGLIKFDGCPDKDGDDIPDHDDSCPDLVGLPFLKGCPDKDLDSIADILDKCPDIPGLPTNEGCPELKTDEPKGTFSFRSGSAEVNPDDHSALDILAENMRANKSFILSIHGHTDSIGSELFNQKLGLRRAEAVKRYLIKQGVEGSRLEIQTHGFSRPKADNSTPEGRASNRRVELIQVNKN